MVAATLHSKGGLDGQPFLCQDEIEFCRSGCSGLSPEDAACVGARENRTAGARARA